MASNNLSAKMPRCSGLIYFFVIILLMIALTRDCHAGSGDGDRAKRNGKTAEHGLGFLNLGRKTFKTSKEDRYKNNLVLTDIKNAQKFNATCIDDSDAVFYRSIYTSSQNWIVHLQAGGSCISESDCLERSNGPLGSSIHMDYSLTGEYTLSDDPKINPTFHSWNKVFIPYCSGDVFVGRMLKRDHPFRMPMLGHYIVTAVIKQLIRDFRINRKGTKILFGGTSAGGLGVLANVDMVQQLVYPAKVKAYNDGGWFTLFPNFGETFLSPDLPKFFNFFTHIFENYWNGYVDETCREQMPKAAACLYGELATKHISTPLYVMVAQWDSYQLTRLIAGRYRSISLPPKKHNERAYLAKFGNNTYRSLAAVTSQSRSGVFSPACHCHTFLTSCFEGSTSCQYPPSNKYSIKGQTAYKALSEWFTSDGKKGTYIEKPKQLPSCNPSCCSSLCYKCNLRTGKVGNEKRQQGGVDNTSTNSTPMSRKKARNLRRKLRTDRQKQKYYLYYSNSSERRCADFTVLLSNLCMVVLFLKHLK
eukprot:gene16178-17803_t